MSDQNPFAAPLTPPEMPPVDGPRQGPRWEQPGSIPTRLFGTIGDCLGGRWVEFFRSMRREGGYFAPLGFCVLATFVFGFAGALVENLLDLAREETDWETALVLQLSLLIATPFLAAAQLGLFSVLHHVALLLLGGSRFPLETTFRVVAYGAGSAMPFALIPTTGGSVLNLGATVAFIAVGLCQAHEISKTKAVAATLLPFLICVGAGVVAVWQFDVLGGFDWLSELEAAD